MNRILYLVTLLLLTVNPLLLWGQSDFPLGYGNRDGTRVTGVIDRNGRYPTYTDKVFYINPNSSVPALSFKFPDYGRIHFSEGCGNRKYVDLYVIYNIDNSDRNSYVVNPSMGSTTTTLQVIAGTSRRMQCIGGGTTHTRETLSTISLTFEHPEWTGLEEIKTVCNGFDKNFNLADFFTVKNEVTFFLDDVNSSPITILNPANLPVGFHKLIARKRYDNAVPDPLYGSKAGDVDFIFEFEVLPSAKITISAFPESVCKNESAFTIVASPSGGVWSGTAIDNAGNFSPSKATTGRNELIYTFQNPNGCSSEKKIEIQAKDAPTLTVKDIFACSTAEPFLLDIASPTGGVYSGRGVDLNNYFDPSKALVGINVIKYTYKDPITTCSASEEFNIDVITAESFRVGEDIQLCTTSPEINLHQKEGVSPADGSIIWSGPGVINEKYFNPALAGIGSHVIQGTLFVPTTGCTYKKSFVIKITQGVPVSAGPDLVLCKNSGLKRLTDAAPAAGTWEGEFVSGGYFNTDEAQVGTYIIKYTYFDGTCSASDSRVISVVPLPVVNAGNDFTICSKDIPKKLPPGQPVGGSWMADGQYLTAGDIIDPSAMKIGANRLTYTVNDGTCSATDELTITVILPPEVEAGENITICINQAPVALQGKPKTGTWNGAGITTGNVFDPLLAGEGEHILTFSYTDPVTKCTNTSSILAKVLPVPELSAGPDLVLCKNSGDFLLSGASPVGGTFQGDFVSAGYFRVTQAPAGIYTVYYSYNNGKCTNTVSRKIQVLDVVTVSAGNDISVCAGDAPLAVPLANPGGGTYSTINGLFYDALTNMIIPEKMQEGKNFLVYTFEDRNNCISRDTVAITLNSLPRITAMNDFSVCENGAPVVLQAKPEGGIFEGSGVDNTQGSVFNPKLGVLDKNEITYTYVAPENGCSARDTIIATINALPVLRTSADTSICIASTPLKLDGSPIGGSWTGTGITSPSIFDPLKAGAGTFTPQYTYTDDKTKCTAYKSISIEVKAEPGRITVAGDTIACNGSRVKLTASAENAQQFSWYRVGEAAAFAEGAEINYLIEKNEQLIVKIKAVEEGQCEGVDHSIQLLSNTPVGTVSHSGRDTLPFGALFSGVVTLTNAEKYEWTFGDGGVSSQKEGAHYYYKAGNYNVTLKATSEKGCTSIFTLKPIIILTEKGELPEPSTDRGTGMDENKVKIRVYPTVVGQQLTILVSVDEKQELDLIFFDQAGNLVQTLKRTAEAGGTNKFIVNDLSFLRGGLYFFLNIKGPGVSESFKLQKL